MNLSTMFFFPSNKLNAALKDSQKKHGTQQSCHDEGKNTFYSNISKTTEQVNDVDYLVTGAPYNQWDKLECK